MVKLKGLVKRHLFNLLSAENIYIVSRCILVGGVLVEWIQTEERILFRIFFH